MPSVHERSRLRDELVPEIRLKRHGLGACVALDNPGRRHHDGLERLSELAEGRDARVSVPDLEPAIRLEPQSRRRDGIAPRQRGLDGDRALRCGLHRTIPRLEVHDGGRNLTRYEDVGAGPKRNPLEPGALGHQATPSSSSAPSMMSYQFWPATFSYWNASRSAWIDLGPSLPSSASLGRTGGMPGSGS